MYIYIYTRHTFDFLDMSNEENRPINGEKREREREDNTYWGSPITGSEIQGYRELFHLLTATSNASGESLNWKIIYTERRAA